MENYILYETTNLVNGKIYIGQTTKSLENRKTVHIYDSKNSNFYFHKAIRKYKPENFTWEIIDNLADNEEDLNFYKNICVFCLELIQICESNFFIFSVIN